MSTAVATLSPAAEQPADSRRAVNKWMVALAVAKGMPRVFVPHPIQDRTDDEMRDYADAAFEEIVKAVTA